MRPLAVLCAAALAASTATASATVTNTTTKGAVIAVTISNHAGFDIRVLTQAQCYQGVPSGAATVVARGETREFDCADTMMYQDDALSLYRGGDRLCSISAVNDGHGGFSVDSEIGTCDAQRVGDYGTVRITYNP